METWIVKCTYKKQDADPLLEFHLISEGQFPHFPSIPGFIRIEYFRTGPDDKSYAEMYMVWESEQCWLDWYSNPENSEFYERGLAQVNEHCQAMGVEFNIIFPPYEETGSTYNGVPITQIEFDEIFLS